MPATPDIAPHVGKLIQFRRDLHAHPELKFEESRTSGQVAAWLQALVSRTVDPLDRAVLTIGRIESGTVENIIPDEAFVYGTCRTLGAATLPTTTCCRPCVKAANIKAE